VIAQLGETGPVIWNEEVELKNLIYPREESLESLKLMGGKRGHVNFLF